MRTAILKWGDSQGVRLPRHLLESAEIDEHDTLEILADNHSIVIKKLGEKPRKSIRERFRGFTGTYEPEAIDWGRPAGKEIW